MEGGGVAHGSELRGCHDLDTAVGRGAVDDWIVAMMLILLKGVARVGTIVWDNLMTM